MKLLCWFGLHLTHFRAWRDRHRTYFGSECRVCWRRWAA